MKSAKEPPPHWANFPLTPYHLMKFHQYYYAIGNTPATNVFYSNKSSTFDAVTPVKPESWHHQTFDPQFEKALHESCRQQNQIRILCLACGDLRNILFSLAGLDGSCAKKINVVVNDYDVHTLARNILLLDGIFDKMNNGITDRAIFSIWFSSALSDEQYKYLQRRLHKLIQFTDKPIQDSPRWHWHCYEPYLLASLRRVWQKWLIFFNGDTEVELERHWKNTQKMRCERFLSKLQRLVSTNTASGSIESQFLDIIKKRVTNFLVKYETSCDSDVFPCKVKEKWGKELSDHLLTGVFNLEADKMANVSWHVNPTLFWSEDCYDLHYGTDSFLAFPFLVPSPKEKIVDLCFHEFKTWLEGARNYRENITFTFSNSDAQVFCMNFDPSMLGFDFKKRKEEHDTIPVQLSHSKSPQCVQFQPGALVSACGLENSPYLNSCVGILTREVPKTKRWGVYFFNRYAHELEEVKDQWSSHILPEKPVSLKQSNLRLVVSNCSLLDPPREFSCFDVITSSNVAEHIGISTLLLLSRPLLIPGGALLTSALNHKGSYKRYMQTSLLGVKSNSWTSLFRFRPMGYESDSSASLACKIGHNPAKSMLDFACFTGRDSSTMIWLATSQESNLPLAPDGHLACNLVKFQQLTENNNRTHNMSGKVAQLLHRHGAQSIAQQTDIDFEMLLLSRVLTSYTDTVGKNRVGNCSLSDMENKIVLCSIQVGNETLRRVFCSDIVPTPTMYVRVKRYKIAGLMAENIEDTTLFMFFSYRNIMETSNWTVDLCSDLVLGETKSVSAHVQEKPVDTTKMEQVCSFLTGGGQYNTPGRDIINVDNGNLRTRNIPGLLTFHLIDESEINFVVKIAISPCIFEHNHMHTKKRITVLQHGYTNHSLIIELQIPCTMCSNGEGRRCIIKKEILFSSPVSSQGWEYQAGTDFLIILKDAHSFFSSARRVSSHNSFSTFRYGSPYSGWSDECVKHISNSQFSFEERGMGKRKVTTNFMMPLLTKVKITVMALFESEELLHTIQINEPGVGNVGLIIRHGLLLDRQTLTPVLDLSVCWLSSETAMDIANATMHLNVNDRMRVLHMYTKEYALLQNLCNYSRASMDQSLHTEHPQLKKLIKNKKVRSFFRRVILKAIYLSNDEYDESQRKILNDLPHLLKNFSKGMGF